MALNTSHDTALFKQLLALGDQSLILGHRLSEWCGHGPILEQDIALTNISLDLIGQCRTYYAAAAELEGEGRTEDDLAYFRTEREFNNPQLVELPNGDFAQTLVRQFLFDAFHVEWLAAAQNSPNPLIAERAVKALKEVNYHVRFSSDWMLRMGDGTEESHRRAQQALDYLWPYAGELFIPTEFEAELAGEGVTPDVTKLKAPWLLRVKSVLEEATLSIPENEHVYKGGKWGMHTEHLGYVLAEMQSLARTYPDAKW